MKSYSRRDFVKFMGASSTFLALPFSSMSFLSSCKRTEVDFEKLGFKPLSPSLEDKLLMAEGFTSKLLISWKDSLNDADSFGFNNDFTAFRPFENKENEGILWVNHEYVHPLFVSGYERDAERTKEMVDMEREEVGGSLVHIKKDRKKNEWVVVKNSKFNKRLSATSKIPLIAPREIDGSKTAIGTLANCSGGVTPWGTFLSAEENYQHYYGDFEHKSDKRRPGWLGWNEFYDHSPRHYGWVVEIEPETGTAKKLTALGRFSHESATVREGKDSKVVVYSGDDKADECIYKFVASKPNSLEEGELFVADLKKGKWLSLERSKSKILQEEFDDQLDVLIHCRKAAKLIGGTPCDRPEDIAINPKNGDIIVALTGNYSKEDLENPDNNFYGSLLKISEENNDPYSESFQSETLVLGGEESGLTCPDNLCFDPKGNLWVTNDISGSMIGHDAYKSFGNNGLFYIPMQGELVGDVFQVLSAPKDAELTGPTFAPDGETLFLSVQHPGEQTKEIKNPTSHWPDGGTSTPRPAVVQISGEAMRKLLKV